MASQHLFSGSQTVEQLGPSEASTSACASLQNCTVMEGVSRILLFLNVFILILLCKNELGRLVV